MKLGIRTFYATRGTVFPVTGWYHLNCGISLTSNRDDSVNDMVCKGCRNKVLTGTSPSPEKDSCSVQQLGAEELVILGGKVTKREAMCQACVHDALMLPMNKGLHQKDIVRLDGYNSLSTAMQEKVYFVFSIVIQMIVRVEMMIVNNWFCVTSIDNIAMNLSLVG